MRRSLAAKIVTLTSLILSVGGLAVVPAQADVQIQGTCDPGKFCLFENINWGGGRKQYANGESDSDFTDTHYDNGKVVNDTASSMINRTGRAIVLFRDTGSRVVCYTAQANTSDSTFVNNTCSQDTSKLVNDNISSSVAS